MSSGIPAASSLTRRLAHRQRRTAFLTPLPVPCREHRSERPTLAGPGGRRRPQAGSPSSGCARRSPAASRRRRHRSELRSVQSQSSCQQQRSSQQQPPSVVRSRGNGVRATVGRECRERVARIRAAGRRPALHSAGPSRSTTCLRCRRFEVAAQLVQVVRHTASSPAHVLRDDARRTRAGEQVGHWHHRRENAIDRRSDRRSLGASPLLVSLVGIGTEDIEQGVVDFACHTVNGSIASGRVATTTSRQAYRLRCHLLRSSRSRCHCRRSAAVALRITSAPLATCSRMRSSFAWCSALSRRLLIARC